MIFLRHRFNEVLLLLTLAQTRCIDLRFCLLLQQHTVDLQNYYVSVKIVKMVFVIQTCISN